MTPDITDQDEREAIRLVQRWDEESVQVGAEEVRCPAWVLRALLHRATRAHD